jgi:hypothetical protein
MKPAVAVHKEVFQPPDMPVRLYLPLVYCRDCGGDDDDRNVVTFTIAITNVGPSEIDVLPLLDEYESYTLTFEYTDPYTVAPDEVSENANDGLLTWHDLTGPAPHGFGRNLPPGASFVFTTVFGVVATGMTITIINTATVPGATDIYSCTADPVEDDALTPVELRYFRAVAEESAVRLEWATAAEVDCVGFYIYKGSRSTYRHIDRDVAPGQVYWYWLAEVGTDGSETTHGPVWGGVGLDASPVRLYLPPVRKDWRGHAVRAQE